MALVRAAGAPKRKGAKAAGPREAAGLRKAGASVYRADRLPPRGVQLSTPSAADVAHHRGMSNSVVRARLVLIWCMSVMTICAWSGVAGAELTLVNAALLSAACVVPSAVMLLVCVGASPVAVAIGGAVTGDAA